MTPGAPFESAYHPARAYLLQKGVFALLALDAWLVMLEHGGRYGMGGFNVTHFGWLDAVLPLPTPALYVGLLSFAGLLAMLMALAGTLPLAKAVLCAVYTLAWVASLHDSYQHHYLLSWLLAWTVFMPDVGDDAASRSERSLVRGWGLPMTAFTCATVYTFTAVSKSEPAWRAGTVLVRLSKSRPVGDPHPGVLDPLRDALGALLGLDASQAFALIAHSVIALQVCVAAGYLASLGRDEHPSRVRTALTALAWLGALSFHAFAEIGHMFDIGWFSYYMLWTSFVMLAPASWVAAVARLVSRPGARLDALLVDSLRLPAGALTLTALLASALVVWLTGRSLDLPGTDWACGTFAAATVAIGLGALARASFVSAQRLALSAVLSAAALSLSLTYSSVRFDYYRLAAGESYDMGQLATALALYEQAERYAPPGKSRAARIDAIRRELAQRDAGP